MNDKNEMIIVATVEYSGSGRPERIEHHYDWGSEQLVIDWLSDILAYDVDEESRHLIAIQELNADGEDITNESNKSSRIAKAAESRAASIMQYCGSEYDDDSYANHGDIWS